TRRSSDLHGYYVGLDPVDGRLFVSRQDDAYQEIASRAAPGGIDRDTWHRLSLLVVTTGSGTELRAELRPGTGAEVITLTAPDPYDSFRSGMVGLRTHSGTADFRAVTVRPVGR